MNNTSSRSVSPSARLAATVAGERAAVLDWRDKAVQPKWYGRTVEDVVAGAPSLDELSTPMMTLDRVALDENIHAMHEWCEAAGVSLAPHGKTIMSPALWQEQLAAGAWAICVANEPQLRLARGVGLSRIIVANLLLGPETLTWLSEELDADDDFEFYCWVDSLEAVSLMNASLSKAGGRRRVSVLIEVGAVNGRTGTRSHAEALAVAEAVIAAPTLALAGVSAFEASAMGHAVDEEGLAQVDEFLERLVILHHALAGRYEVGEALLSAGGSVYFDRVAAVLGPHGVSEGDGLTRVVLRSGAYIVHDDGLYREVTPSTRGAGPILRSAMHVWARVISIHEPGIAYLDAGKRDLPFDEGLPEVQLARRIGAGGTQTFPLRAHEVFRTNDQHTFVRLPEDSPLRVGDVVRLGLSHPCTAFDKWSLIPVVDSASIDSPTVVDLVRTYF
jgi:D-serine deaminase-like pyridoxal phosphate-dependent protein